MVSTVSPHSKAPSQEVASHKTASCKTCLCLAQSSPNLCALVVRLVYLQVCTVHTLCTQYLSASGIAGLTSHVITELWEKTTIK